MSATSPLPEPDPVAALRATAHPLRLRILSLLTGASMSAAEVARELGTTQANASYHLRVLATAGEVVPDGEVKVRGGIAKRYRHVWDGPQRATGDRAHHVQAMAAELTRRSRHRHPRSRSYLCDAELWVTTEVWQEALDLIERAGAMVHAQALAPHAEGAVHVNLQAVAFQMRDER